MAINSADLKVRLVNKPQQVYISERNCAIKVNVILPTLNEKQVDTELELVYRGSETAKVLSFDVGDWIYVSDGAIRHDFDQVTKKDSWRIVSYTPIQKVDESFYPYNKVILFGRFCKDLDPNNPLDLKYFGDWVVCNRSIVVSTGPKQGEFFNITAIGNNNNGKFNLATNLADEYPKGTTVAVKGKIVSNSWIDKNTKEPRTSTKLEINSINKAYVNTNDNAVNAYVSAKTQAVDTSKTPDTVPAWSPTASNEEAPF